MMNLSFQLDRSTALAFPSLKETLRIWYPGKFVYRVVKYVFNITS